jgi:hypothetical protein
MCGYDEFPEGIDVSSYRLTVNREKLVELLVARRAEIDTFYDAKIEAIDEQLELAKDPNKAWVEYYSTMSKRVKDGTLLRDDTRERGQKWVPAPGHPAQPELPQLPDVAVLTAEREAYVERCKNYKRPYDTAISMLEIAVGDEVTIPTSEYENLIKAPVSLY